MVRFPPPKSQKVPFLGIFCLFSFDWGKKRVGKKPALNPGTRVSLVKVLAKHEKKLGCSKSGAFLFAGSQRAPNPPTSPNPRTRHHRRAETNKHARTNSHKQIRTAVAARLDTLKIFEGVEITSRGEKLARLFYACFEGLFWRVLKHNLRK